MNKQEKLLAWIAGCKSGMLLESQAVASGYSKTLNELLLEGKVDLVEHPTVKDGNAPACAIVLRAVEAPRGNTAEGAS